MQTNEQPQLCIFGLGLSDICMLLMVLLALYKSRINIKKTVNESYGYIMVFFGELVLRSLKQMVQEDNTTGI